MNERIYYLNKNIVRKFVILDVLALILLMVFSFVLYFYFEGFRSVLLFLPVLLFIFYKSLVFSKRSKALIICSHRVYSWRSGWITEKEVKKAYISGQGDNKCIMFELNYGLYAPTMYTDWSLYSLPSTMIILCQGDCREDIEVIFNSLNGFVRQK